jgi:predicted P-loop ATPase
MSDDARKLKQTEAVNLVVPMGDAEYAARRKEIAIGCGWSVVVLDRERRAAQRALRPVDWTDNLRRTDKQRPRASLLNAMIALRTAPVWAGVWGFDLFSQKVMVDAPPPWGGEAGSRPMSDVDATFTAAWLQANDIDVSSEVAFEAIRAVATDRSRHPVRDYLGGLVWDNVPRIDTWLIDHMGATDSALHRAFGGKWLISAVARVMEPGVKADVCLVLEGAQNLGKSTALAALAGRGWFSDQGSPIDNKDAKVELLGIWIREIAEFAAIRRAAVESTKAWLSTQVDNFRKPYGRVSEAVPRQTVFAATINPGGSGYLLDDTGARRFWCVACGEGWAKGRTVDLARLVAERDQFWAEATARYRMGEAWWLDRLDLQEAQEEAADQRYEGDPWEEDISRHLESVAAGTPPGDVPETTTAQILRSLRKTEDQFGRADQTRVGGVMVKQAGWKKVRTMKGKARVWVFRMVEPIAQPAQPGPTLSELVGQG